MLFIIHMRSETFGSAGQPEFALDVDNIKPTGVVIGAALAVLLLNKPLSGSRGFGGIQFSLPGAGSLVAKVCSFFHSFMVRGA
jgi:hypothetical protein